MRIWNENTVHITLDEIEAAELEKEPSEYNRGNDDDIVERFYRKLKKATRK